MKIIPAPLTIGRSAITTGKKGWELAQQASFRTISDGARAGIEVSKSFLNSTVVQKIWLYDDVARIDFETEIDWRRAIWF